jgi:hypothetical protein
VWCEKRGEFEWANLNCMVVAPEPGPQNGDSVGWLTYCTVFIAPLLEKCVVSQWERNAVSEACSSEGLTSSPQIFSPSIPKILMPMPRGAGILSGTSFGVREEYRMMQS